MSPATPTNPQTEARILALEDAVKDIRDAVVTIARLEERHAETREAINRCFQSAEKNANVILAVKADNEERVALLRSEYEALKFRLAQIEARISPLEELRGVAMKGVWALVGIVGMALVGLVLVK